jgi:hypothetical protein
MTHRGADPWSAADALVGWLGLDEPEERARGTRADHGVRPTISVHTHVNAGRVVN